MQTDQVELAADFEIVYNDEEGWIEHSTIGFSNGKGLHFELSLTADQEREVLKKVAAYNKKQSTDPRL